MLSKRKNIHPIFEGKLQRSQYELTLAEFPLFLLSKGGKGNTQAIKCIEYYDTIQGKNDVVVPREWRVYPHPKYGFGTVSTFETFFDLWQIWKEDNFRHQYIRFGSPYQLLKRRGQVHCGKNHYRIIRDLNCLTGITIEAKNAYWDNEVKAYVDATFHLFDYLRLYKEEPSGTANLPYGSIKASDVLYGSIQKNSILLAYFDADFFHSLAPLEKRLALYLSKVFRSQAVHKRNIVDLAQQIPIYAKQTKHIKESLKKACTGLIQKGFKLLDDFSFKKANDGKTQLIIFKRKGRLPANYRKNNSNIQVGRGKDPDHIKLLVEDILDICKDKKSERFYKKVAMLMPEITIYRALAEVKEVRNLGKMKRNEGALFTSLIKKYAQEQGVNL